MEITTKILKERFIEYNKRYFDDKLPMVDFRRHRTGNPFARLNTPNNGNLSISFSTVYNWNDKLIRDTLIHEMIHLYLVVNKKEWIFDHGIPFHLCCLKIPIEIPYRRLRLVHKIPPVLNGKSKYILIQKQELASEMPNDAKRHASENRRAIERSLVIRNMAGSSLGEGRL